MVKTCVPCGKELVAPDNWYPSYERSRRHICKACQVAAVKKSNAKSPTFEAYQRKWRDENAERLSQARREAYVGDRAEKMREANRRWHRENPDKSTANSSRRRARKLAASPDNADQVAIAGVYAMAARLTQLFGTPYHVDHLIPLSKGGLHHQDNLVVMLGTLNAAKGDRVIPGLAAFFGHPDK